MISNVVDASKQAVNVGTGVIVKGASVAVESAKAVHENAKLIYNPGEKEGSNGSNDKQLQVIVKQLQICGIKLESNELDRRRSDPRPWSFLSRISSTMTSAAMLLDPSTSFASSWSRSCLVLLSAAASAAQTD